MTKKKEQELETKIEELDVKIDHLTKAVDRMLTYIESDPLTGRRGIFEQQNLNIQKINKMEDDLIGVKNGIKTDKKVVTGKIGVATLIFSAVGWFLMRIFGLIKLTI